MSDALPPFPLPTPTGATPAGPRILVVDDEDLVRLVIAKRLQRAGFDVVQARDGLDALALLSGVDLVLTDLNMPRCNGERLCLEIKRRPEGSAIVVVLMTGGPLDEARMREIGCAGVVYKPLPDRLPELLAAFLRDAAPASRSGEWAGPGGARRTA